MSETLYSDHHQGTEKKHTIKVLIYTLEGRWPQGHAADVPKKESIRETLAQAAKDLGLVDTSDWIARIDGNEVNIDKSFEQDHISCLAEIDYGPRESGGGSHA